MLSSDSAFVSVPRTPFDSIRVLDICKWLTTGDFLTDIED